MRRHVQLSSMPLLAMGICATLQAASPSTEEVNPPGVGETIVPRTHLINDIPSDSAAPLTWRYFTEDNLVHPRQVWHVEDGVIFCKGSPRGYIRTDQAFINFKLQLEWRWPEGKEPGRGGVLVRMTGGDKIWPKSLEAQINSPDAGDFWGLIGYNLAGPADRYKQLEHDQFGKLTNLKKIKAAEKPPGQWNTYEILAEGPKVTLKINGQMVNQATGCDVVPGKICITSEGDEIHFRNIRLIPETKPADK